MTTKIRGFVPRFITIEGGEGAGKTTLLHHLEKWFKSQDLPLVRTREPGGTALGEEIRHWLLTHNAKLQIDAKAELLLFLAARAQHIDEVIAPAIHAGQVVVCDRFNDSTIAYQGAARGLGIEWVQSLCKMVCGPIVPDLTFYLDIDPIIGLARTRHTAKATASAGEIDRIEAERVEFHQQVRHVFLELAKQEPQRIFVIDAEQPQKTVWDTAQQLLETHFQVKAKK